MKYAASIVEDLPIGSVFTKFTLSDSNINELLSEFIAASEDANTLQPYFHAACNWVKGNYDIWSDWVEPLPPCTLEEHVATRIIGCEAGSSVRQIEFKWKSPNPESPLLPNNCDGGLPALPSTIITSRSCNWIRDNFRRSGWADSKPTCDSSFYDYTVSPCDSTGYQTVQYHWNLPRAENDRVSAECESGVSLPPSSNVKCDFRVKSVRNCADFCETWQRTNTSRDASNFNDRWLDIGMAFVSNLPRTSSGSDAVVIITDKLTGKARFLPSSSSASVTDFSCMFCMDHQQVHGIPRSITMDRSVKLTSNLWQGVKQLINTFTPSADGQANAFVVQFLQYFLKSHQDNWEDVLPVAEDIYIYQR